MGALLSLLQKKSSREELDEIEESIKNIVEGNRNIDDFHRHVQSVISRSAIALFLLGLVYIYFFPAKTRREVAVFGGALFILALIGIFARRILSWYHQFNKRNNNRKLRDLEDKKKDVLKKVMEKETYAVAKTILEKYAPSKLISPSLSASQSGALIPSPNQLRQRVGSVPQQAVRPLQVLTPVTLPGNQRPGILDKVAEMLVGEGAQNRYALICSSCHTHNGLALPEEFEYMSFRCLSCKQFHPARKHRPSPPKLPTVNPKNEMLPEPPPTDGESEEEEIVEQEKAEEENKEAASEL